MKMYIYINYICIQMLGYLRMATKVSTIIAQVIQGKVVSVTICHECLDVRDQCFSLCIVLTICCTYIRRSQKMKSLILISPYQCLMKLCLQ